MLLFQRAEAKFETHLSHLVLVLLGIFFYTFSLSCPSVHCSPACLICLSFCLPVLSLSVLTVCQSVFLSFSFLSYMSVISVCPSVLPPQMFLYMDH